MDLHRCEFCDFDLEFCMNGVEFFHFQQTNPMI